MTSFAAAMMAGWALSLAFEYESMTACLVFFINAFIIVAIAPTQLQPKE